MPLALHYFFPKVREKLISKLSHCRDFFYPDHLRNSSHMEDDEVNWKSARNIRPLMQQINRLMDALGEDELFEEIKITKKLPKIPGCQRILMLTPDQKMPEDKALDSNILYLKQDKDQITVCWSENDQIKTVEVKSRQNVDKITRAFIDNKTFEIKKSSAELFDQVALLCGYDPFDENRSQALKVWMDETFLPQIKKINEEWKKMHKRGVINSHQCQKDADCIQIRDLLLDVLDRQVVPAVEALVWEGSVETKKQASSHKSSLSSSLVTHVWGSPRAAKKVRSEKKQTAPDASYITNYFVGFFGNLAKCEIEEEVLSISCLDEQDAQKFYNILNTLDIPCSQPTKIAKVGGQVPYFVLNIDLIYIRDILRLVGVNAGSDEPEEKQQKRINRFKNSFLEVQKTETTLSEQSERLAIFLEKKLQNWPENVSKKIENDISSSDLQLLQEAQQHYAFIAAHPFPFFSEIDFNNSDITFETIQKALKELNEKLSSLEKNSPELQLFAHFKWVANHYDKLNPLIQKLYDKGYKCVFVSLEELVNKTPQKNEFLIAIDKNGSWFYSVVDPDKKVRKGQEISLKDFQKALGDEYATFIEASLTAQRTDNFVPLDPFLPKILKIASDRGHVCFKPTSFPAVKIASEGGNNFFGPKPISIKLAGDKGVGHDERDVVGQCVIPPVQRAPRYVLFAGDWLSTFSSYITDYPTLELLKSIKTKFERLTQEINNRSEKQTMQEGEEIIFQALRMPTATPTRGSSTFLSLAQKTQEKEKEKEEPKEEDYFSPLPKKLSGISEEDSSSVEDLSKVEKEKEKEKVPNTVPKPVETLGEDIFVPKTPSKEENEKKDANLTEKQPKVLKGEKKPEVLNKAQQSVETLYSVSSYPYPHNTRNYQKTNIHEDDLIVEKAELLLMFLVVFAAGIFLVIGSLIGVLCVIGGSLIATIGIISAKHYLTRDPVEDLPGPKGLDEKVKVIGRKSTYGELEYQEALKHKEPSFSKVFSDDAENKEFKSMFPDLMYDVYLNRENVSYKKLGGNFVANDPSGYTLFGSPRLNQADGGKNEVTGESMLEIPFWCDKPSTILLIPVSQENASIICQMIKVNYCSYFADKHGKPTAAAKLITAELDKMYRALQRAKEPLVVLSMSIAPIN